MNKILTSTFVSILLLTSSISAGTLGPITPVPDWRWVGSFSAGPVWANGGDTQRLFLTPEIEKAYVANNHAKALFDGEIFGGVQHTLYAQKLMQLGLAVAATSDARLSGIIWDDADPAFDNYSYRYDVQHTHIAAKAKFLADIGYWCMPWASGSIGVGFNRASFDSMPLIFEAVPTPNFSTHTTTAFTYTVGLGLQRAFTANWQGGIGYEFADWGKSRLGLAPGQTLTASLHANHIYTNGVLLNLTYLL